MKNTIKISIILSFIFITAFLQETSAQNNILYGMHNIPQTINTNPAKQPGCNVFIGYPAISGIYLDVNNSALTLGTIFKPRADQPDSFLIDLDAIENAMGETNYINAELNISILNFGFRLHNGFYFNFGINNRTIQNFAYPKALMEIRRGNYREGDEPLSFNFFENFMNYNEYSVGLSKQFHNNITVGGKIKVLSGNANFRTQNLDIDWRTETAVDSMYEWTFDTQLNAQSASIIAWDSIIDGNVNIEDYKPMDLIFTGNTGLAVDLGIEYKYNNKLQVSASVLDLGFIKWKTDAQVYTQEGTFRFSGLDIGSYFSDVEEAQGVEPTTITDDMVDTLLNFIDPTIEELAYTTGLNTKIFVGANYFVTKNIDFGLLYKGQIYNKTLFSSYTVSVNTNFFKAWSFSAAYSIMDNMYNNLGLGLAYRLGPIQMYLLTDNFSTPFWAMNESEASDSWLRNTKRVNFQFGLNFLICNQKVDSGLLQ